MNRDKLRTGISELICTVKTDTEVYDEIVQKIKELVPEYTGSNSALRELVNNKVHNN